MQDLEAKEFVYLSIKNETKKLSISVRISTLQIKQDETDPFSSGVFAVNC